jgi:diguanylate cyclase (GGDEF)-like protein
MSGDDAKAPPRRAEVLRTKPLEDGGSMREALLAELRKAASPSLVVVAGPDVGKRVRLERSIEVGRDPAAPFPLSDESVSRFHVRVEDRGDGAWAAVDLGSTNGMLVNGAAAREALLGRGHRIFIGNSILEFQVEDAISLGFNAEVERMLSEDDLSGLWVKRRFDAELATTVAAIQAGSVPQASVIVMDLDGVKAINDTHGHDMGAFVIGAAGHVIGETLGERGFATRFGGDEFAAALPATGKDLAVAIAEELRVAVVAHVYERNGVRVYPGMSCGVAVFPEDAEDAPGVFRAADQAMYRAKRGGKNRVAV